MTPDFVHRQLKNRTGIGLFALNQRETRQRRPLFVHFRCRCHGRRDLSQIGGLLIIGGRGRPGLIVDIYLVSLVNDVGTVIDNRPELHPNQTSQSNRATLPNPRSALPANHTDARCPDAPPTRWVRKRHNDRNPYALLPHAPPIRPFEYAVVKWPAPT